MLTFLVATVVLTASVGTMLLTTKSQRGGDATDLQVQADNLAGLLVDSAGIGWDAQAGSFVRIGLRQPDAQSLHRPVLDAMRGAGSAADPHNGLIDYEEALASLDAQRYGLHISIAPVGLAATLAALDLSGIRTAYIGHWDGTPSGLVVSEQHEPMAASGRLQVDSTMAARAGIERTALDDLGLGFDNDTDLDSIQIDVKVQGSPQRHITEVVPSDILRGDVWPDRKQYLSSVLPARLGGYDLLVVGSGVQHSTMTADAVKTAIRDWVLDGGTLLVLGSESQSTQWLQPLFHAGNANVNGVLETPYASHPMLREPHELPWQDYSAPSNAWDIQDRGAHAHEDDFDHVIRSGDGDVLAVSRPGAFGNGTVILTTFQPGAWPDGAAQAMPFLHNIVVYSDRSHLYLNYGPSPSWKQEVAATARHTLFEDDDLGPVPVRVEVLIWRIA